jgi:predicted nuclease of restriction endonuclease-like RecB superfamily
MLTSDLAISWRRGRAIGPRLVDPRDTTLLGVASELVAIVARNRGRQRAMLDAELDAYVGVGTDYKVLRGLIKLLEDRCTFAVAGALDPSDVRRSVFLVAAERYPVSVQTRESAIADAARALGASAEDVERALFGDLAQRLVLVEFDAPEPGALLEAYNLAQAQALLYRAVRMTLTVEPQAAEGYRRVFSAIKAYRLIHTISGSALDGYVVELDGPVSMFHRSQKYGIQMAVFLPALLACHGWSMEAEIEVKSRGPAYYSLSSRDAALRSDYVRFAADRSPVVEKLLSTWSAHGGDYTLEASREVLDLGGEAFVPDLVLTSPDDRRVYVEVLGFWTPKTLAARLKALDAAHFGSYLLVAAEDFMASRERPSEVPPHVVLFKSSLDPRHLRAAAERLLA